MGYVAPTWQNGGPPALNAKNMQDISDNLAYVSNHMVNPSLLDNWYFGNPVDQKGGYISLQGVPVYNDAACTSLIGNQIETAATCIKSGTNYQRIINGQGGGYVKAADVVRGYTGPGYGIDRWIVQSVTAGAIKIDNGGITVMGQNNDGVLQKIGDGEYYRGKQVTLSALLTSGVLWTKTLTIPQAGIDAQILEWEPGADWSCAVKVDNDILYVWHLITYGQSTQKSISVKAVGLEFGTQQTLAHKEYGEWVFNEVPKFGDQLAECQRHCVAFNIYDSFLAIDNNDFVVELPVPMRATPTIINPQNITNANVTNPTVAWYNIGSNQLRLRSTASHGGSPAVCNGLVLFSADL